VSAGQTVDTANFSFSLKPTPPEDSISGALAFVDGGGAVPSGWTVYLDANNNGKLDPGEKSTATVNAGEYSFNGLAGGSYIVRVIPPAGYTQVTPSNDYGEHVTLASNQSEGGVNFAFEQVSTAAIYGTVFNDANGDGKNDNGETGLAGWSVYLDLNNSGSYVAGDPVPTTDSDGNYFFTDLPAGTYIVRVEPQNGWTQTSPSNDYGQHITLGVGQQVDGVDFEMYMPTLSPL
jgi:uncharacterized protein (DUF2141 family)